MTGQMQIFEVGTTLLDCSLEQRAAAAQMLIETTATDLAEREALLALVCWPTSWTEAES